MGRKIKGCKHHGTKDPEKQRQNRENLVKMKINNRPGGDLDTQEMPRRMKELMVGLKEEDFKRVRKNRGDKKVLDSTRHQTKESWVHGCVKPLRPIPVFKQKEGEHKKAFYYRMHQTIQSMKQQRSYEEKYNVEVKMDEHGQTSTVPAQPDVVEGVQEENNKKKNKKLKKGVEVKTKEEKRIARRERDKMRKNKKKGRGNQSDEELDFDSFKDSYEFGEVAHEPPTLNYKPKKLQVQEPQDEERKPGKKDLLLKAQLNGGIVKKVKKNKPSLAKQVIMEKERIRVVEAYRALKAERMSN